MSSPKEFPTSTAPVFRGQRGVALVTVLVFLLILSVVAAGLMLSVNTDSRLASYEVQSNKALTVAEAGVAEAVERISQGDVPDTLNPKMTTLIFLADAGSVPNVGGGDTTALGTDQDAVNRLAYSTPDLSPNVLRVRFKTDPARTVVYKYDPARVPAIQTATGSPIYVIRSTGRVGNAVRTIETEVFTPPAYASLKGAVVSKEDTKLEDFYVCGYDHRIDTPTWTTKTNGRNAAAGACNEDAASNKWELNGGSTAGLWAGKKGELKNSTAWGTPATLINQGKNNFYAGAWEIYGMTQSDFFDMLGRAQKYKKNKSSLSGIRYFKKNVDIKTGNGEGLLYVNGDLHIKGDFTYRGLIYCTKEIQMDGKAWILGGVVGKKIKFNDKARGVVLYSKAAISRPLELESGSFVRLSWREIN